MAASQWEYLEVYVFPDPEEWMDSTGRVGKMPMVHTRTAAYRWPTSAEALNTLGAEGWELVGIVTASQGYRLLLKRPQGLS